MLVKHLIKVKANLQNILKIFFNGKAHKVDKRNSVVARNILLISSINNYPRRVDGVFACNDD